MADEIRSGSRYHRPRTATATIRTVIGLLFHDAPSDLGKYKNAWWRVICKNLDSLWQLTIPVLDSQAAAMLTLDRRFYGVALGMAEH